MGREAPTLQEPEPDLYTETLQGALCALWISDPQPVMEKCWELPMVLSELNGTLFCLL